MKDDLVTVDSFLNTVEAEMAKALLDAEGIEAFIHAPHAHDLYPGALGEVRLQVRERDLARAKEVLASRV